jgi:hypothetical protein
MQSWREDAVVQHQYSAWICAAAYIVFVPVVCDCLRCLLFLLSPANEVIMLVLLQAEEE